MIEQIIEYLVKGFAVIIILGCTAYVVSRMGVKGFLDGLKKISRKENNDEEG